MNRIDKIKKIEDAVNSALSKYSTENVDIDIDCGMVDIIYHSRHVSFAIMVGVCEVEGLTENDIAEISDRFDIGYCWR